MLDGLGTTRYTYTASGQLLTEDGPFPSDTVTYSYANRLRGAGIIARSGGQNKVSPQPSGQKES
jgi:hypothetical protein